MKFTKLALLALSSCTALAADGNDNDSDNEAAIEKANPLKDDFYEATDDYESKKPGDILKSRKSPTKLTFTNYENAYQIMYRTTDSLNNATYSITSVVVPKNAKKDRFVSYQYAEDSSWAPCAPSYSMINTDADSFAQGILNTSMILVSPDYEGPNSAFCAGQLAGHAVLDSIRAVLQFKDLGLDKDTKYGLFGYSGGSLASGWAAQLQPSYAPELDLKGVAVGGFITNVTEVALNANGKLTAGFVPAGIVGLSTEYPAVDKLLTDDLYPTNSSMFMKAQNQCVANDLLTYFQQDIFSYFKGGQSVLQKKDIQPILKNLTMAQDGAAPKAPMFVFEGISDEIAPIKMVDGTIKSYCDSDANIQYYKMPGKSHESAQEAGGMPGAEWLYSMIDGGKAEKGCKTITTDFKNFKPSKTMAGGGSNNGTASATKSSSASATGAAKTSAASQDGQENAAPAITLTSLVVIPFLSLLL